MDNLQTFCKKWSSSVKKYNYSSVKYRKQIERILQEMSFEEKKKAVKILDLFIFNNNDLLDEEIGKLDDKVAEVEKLIIAVRIFAVNIS